MTKIRLAIFASGTGSNAMNLIRYFASHPQIEVAFVVSNNPNAPILNTAADAGIATFCFTNVELSSGDFLTELCSKNQIDWIMLAGYLRLIPSSFIAYYENKIINLHPSLLPNYGGKGMYGHHVHEAVIANKEPESGITIHYVNQEFDKGEIIAQFKCSLTPDDDAQSLASKIHELEQNNLPKVVEATILNEK